MAEIEELKSDRRLKSLDEFDQKPIYVLSDQKRPTNGLVVATLGLVVGVALGLVLLWF